MDKKGDVIIMSKKQLKRYNTILSLINKLITTSHAMEILGLSRKQIYRLKKGVKQSGHLGVFHGNCGKTPYNSLSTELRNTIITLASTTMYKNTNYTELSELLLENHQIKVSRPTLSRILRKEGIISPKTCKPRKKRCSRPRSPSTGTLVLADASKFKWLEDRGPELTLLATMDDATGKILGATFRHNEDLIGYFIALRQTITNYGIPFSFLSDRHATFIPNKSNPDLEEQFEGKINGTTQFGRALLELSIFQKFAFSPEGKGRIERVWQTLQNRLTTQLRIHNICTLEDSNIFLETYIPKFNKRFEYKPTSDINSFKPIAANINLDNIICIKDIRRSSKGSTISYKGKTYTLVDKDDKTKFLTYNSKVHICTDIIDKSMWALYNDNRYTLKEFPKYEKTYDTIPKEITVSKYRGHIPAPDHPWRKPFITKNLNKKSSTSKMEFK